MSSTARHVPVCVYGAMVSQCKSLEVIQGSSARSKDRVQWKRQGGVILSLRVNKDNSREYHYN